MKEILKIQKGITMITLSIAIVILVLISNILIYNGKEVVHTKKLENMYNDVESLRDKVIDYNVQYGTLPICNNIEYSLDGRDDLKDNWISQEEKEEGKFYVIDLKALEGVTLNYGRDYEKVTQEMSTENISRLEDIYIVNSISQNVFYVKGIDVKNKKYYSDREKDETVIDIKYAEETGGSQTLKPGDKATSTKKDNYTDTSNKKATIPQGFKVSSEDYEIDTGLVVEAPDGSEFVWVPVEKAIANDEATGGSTKSMAVVDPTDGNNYRGILYNFEGTNSSVMTGCTTTHFDNPGSESYREPAYLTAIWWGDADPDPTQNNGRVTEAGLKAEYKSMIESVEQYRGFFVGRYETSLIGGNKAQSKKGETPMDSTGNSGDRWWGMYEKEKNYAEDSNISSVESSMIWGSQYDAMLNWILKGDDANKVASESPKHYGTTGSTEGDVMNKIYDLGNNFWEWTLEANGTGYRVLRGSYYDYPDPPSNRNIKGPADCYLYYGSRLALYIK